jgi:hypothetical protein
MWSFEMYEFLTTERINSYRREAARDRQLLRGTVEPSPIPVPAANTPVPSTRRALVAAFVGLVTINALRRRP